MNALGKWSGKWSIASFLASVLGAAWYFLALILVLTAGLVVASPFLDLSNAELSVPVSFHLDAAYPVAAPSLGIDRAEIRDVRGTLIIPPSPGLFTPGLAVAGMLALGLWVIGELRAVFRTLRDGRPFAAANSARIRRVAWIIMLSEPVRALIDYGANAFVAARFTSPGLLFEASPELNVLTIVNGLIVLVIAEVFRAGTRLDEDQSLTI